ncbi:alpha/beta hydrolase [Sphingobium sp. B12D2B]|uniref:alpha/beta hydrolase n=1 Tax=Sphingobium sp. B12D2B TaxID=2940577 RepID=UPI0022255B2C|nr:lysophospholipase [Sphingobium sp. B12D2B]MCW2350037.1 pimeloyl-ACP methyl ester carboxylesterase [Sphingobium sp. B12D2B]
MRETQDRPGKPRHSRRGRARQTMVLLALLGMTPGCASLSRDVLYSPHNKAAVTRWVGAPPQTISVTTKDHLALTGYYWPGAPGDPDIFVMFHGRNWNAEMNANAAQHLAGTGNAVLAASYRGFGANPGRPSEDGLMTDASAFIAKAGDLAGPGARIWLIGHSLGSSVALHAAAREPDIAGVIAMSVFVRIAAAAPKISRAFIPDRWDNREALKAIKVPVLFVQGDLDRLVPKTSADTLFAAYSGPSSLVTGVASRHNPDMALLSPWLNRVIEAMRADPHAAVPKPPTGWLEKVHRP